MLVLCALHVSLSFLHEQGDAQHTVFQAGEGMLVFLLFFSLLMVSPSPVFYHIHGTLCA